MQVNSSILASLKVVRVRVDEPAINAVGTRFECKNSDHKHFSDLVNLETTSIKNQ